MPACSHTKRTYHPIVLYLFYTGLLDNQYLSCIPASTLQHWRDIRHEMLYGYDWVKDHCMGLQEMQVLHKRKVVLKAALVCCRIIQVFADTFCKVKNYHRVLRGNASQIIAAIDRLLHVISLAQACRIFRITTRRYYRWKQKVYCTASVLNLCFKTHPGQLTTNEAGIIQQAIQHPDHAGKPLSTIRYQLMRDGQLFVGAATFYKYAGLLLQTERARFEKPPYQPLRAERLWEYLHVDITHILTEVEGQLKVAFVKENFSKAIVAKAILKDGKSGSIRQLLQSVYEKYGLHDLTDPVYLVSDGGPENKGEVSAWLQSLPEQRMLHITAKQDIPQSNSMSESTHHIFKNVFLHNRSTHDRRELWEQLDRFENYYNWDRYPVSLYGYAPMEVLLGALPDQHLFRQAIRKARKSRYLANQKQKSCEVCK